MYLSETGDWFLKTAADFRKRIHHCHCRAVMDSRWARGRAMQRRDCLALLSLSVTAAS